MCAAAVFIYTKSVLRAGEAFWKGNTARSSMYLQMTHYAGEKYYEECQRVDLDTSGATYKEI